MALLGMLVLGGIVGYFIGRLLAYYQGFRACWQAQRQLEMRRNRLWHPQTVAEAKALDRAAYRIWSLEEETLEHGPGHFRNQQHTKRAMEDCKLTESDLEVAKIKAQYSPLP